MIYREYTECYSISFLLLFFFHKSSLYPIKIFALFTSAVRNVPVSMETGKRPKPGGTMKFSNLLCTPERKKITAHLVKSGYKRGDTGMGN